MVRDALGNFQGGNLSLVIASLPFKCPAAPYEAMMLIESFLKRRRLREKTTLHLYTPEPYPLPVTGPEIGGEVQKILEERGISFHPNMKIKEIKGDTRELLFSDGKQATFDLLLGVPPHRPSDPLPASGLLGKSGWVEVDPFTLKTGFENVYAIGDSTGIKIAGGKMLPKAGVFAHYEGEVVAQNIAQEIRGKKPDKTFRGDGQCFMEVGGGKAGFARGNFYREPSPNIRMYPTGRRWHWKKLLFEWYWFRSWF